MRVLVTGANGSMSKAVADWLKTKEDFDVVQMSVRGDSWKTESFSQFDSIVHIAGITPQNAKSEEDYYAVNTKLTAELGEKASKDGVGQFVYISSMAVYGLGANIDRVQGLVTGNTLCNPDSMYGRSKLEAENRLRELQPGIQKLAIIRVPSVYGKSNTAYMDIFKGLGAKLSVIPDLFRDNYRSAIYIDNLCELIYLVISNGFSGIVCPDDGQTSVVDFCQAIYPEKKTSKVLGKLIELFLKNNDRIAAYYGAIYYCEELTNVFDGKYRVRNLSEAVKLTYE